MWDSEPHIEHGTQDCSGSVTQLFSKVVTILLDLLLPHLFLLSPAILQGSPLRWAQRGAAAHWLSYLCPQQLSKSSPASRHHLPFLREASLHSLLFHQHQSSCIFAASDQLLRIFSESSADTWCCSSYERKLSCSLLRFNFPRQPLLTPTVELILIKMNEIAHLFLHLEKSVWPATTIVGGTDAKLILHSESSGLQLQRTLCLHHTPIKRSKCYPEV